VNITILVPNFFTGATEPPAINIENAIVVQPNETPQHSTETIGGLVFAGITISYLVYPQEPGTFRLPPVDLPITYAATPPKSISVHVALPALSFDATIPPQAADLDYFLPTTSLTITQRFDKPLKSLRVGDTVTRTITVDAARLRAMLLPPVQFEAPEGIAVYAKQPSVEDIRTDRQEFVAGRRVDSATYLIRREGKYLLPSLGVEWWDLNARKVQTASVPAIEFTAVPNPGYQSELSPEPPATVPAAPSRAASFKRYLRWAVRACAILIPASFLLWMWFRFGRRVLEWRRSQADAHKQSEPSHFARLRKACAADDAAAAYSSLLAWLGRFQPGVSLSDFLRQAGDHELTQQIERLAAMLYSPDTKLNWSGKRMIHALRGIRSRHRTRTRLSALPPLNPVNE
jgi:hypothetical protein